MSLLLGYRNSNSVAVVFSNLYFMLHSFRQNSTIQALYMFRWKGNNRLLVEPFICHTFIFSMTDLVLAMSECVTGTIWIDCNGEIDYGILLRWFNDHTCILVSDIKVRIATIWANSASSGLWWLPFQRYLWLPTGRLTVGSLRYALNSNTEIHLVIGDDAIEIKG